MASWPPVTHQDVQDELGLLRSSAASFVEAAVGSEDNQTIGSAFTKLRLSFISGNSALFDDATDEYIAPENGVYFISASFRAADDTVQGASYGVGVHTSAQDGPWFAWASFPQTTIRRQTLVYERLLRLTTNQRLQMFAYTDGSLIAVARSLRVVRLTP